LDFDFNGELDRVIMAAREAGADNDEIVSEFELKIMALNEEQPDGE